MVIGSVSGQNTRDDSVSGGVSGICGSDLGESQVLGSFESEESEGGESVGSFVS